MQQEQTSQPRTPRVKTGRQILGITACVLGGAGFLAVLTWSGITAFQRDAQPVALAATDADTPDSRAIVNRPAPSIKIDVPKSNFVEVGIAGIKTPADRKTPAKAIKTPAAGINTASDIKTDRLGKPIYVNGKPWTGPVFDHRPIRKVKTITMKTTAYSPDHRSCGKWADGITASGKSVWMNAGKLVAADRKIPFGTILTIPGYNNGQPVQVWDRGGAIKGNRLDLLYPTHNVARQWGVQNKRVVFWEFVKTD